jgi:DNA repair exonuclease SbcCD nuclease subunit
MTSLRVIAFSDVHIGSYGSAVDEDGLNLGLKSNDRVRQFIVDHAKRVQPDLIIFVGDLYKSAIGRPTQTEQWRAAQFFTQLCEIAPVVAKVGNHDEGEGTRGDGIHALQIFDAMNLRMTVLPNPEKWSVINVEGVRIALFHGMLSGVRLESGMLSDSVKPEGLASIWEAPKADLYLLGDIHHRQFLAENAAYCGACDRLNFGEEDEVPTFWDLTIDTQRDSDGKVKVKWDAIQTPARKFVTLTDESEIETVDVTGAVVRFEGELRNFTHGELVSKLKARGAVEVPNVADTSEFDETPSLYTSFDPIASYAIWLDAQSGITKDDKSFSQQLLVEMLST